VVLDAGARSSAFMLDGRSRTASGLVRDVHYEHDAHSAVFLHRKDTEGASIFTEAESARVFEKLHSAMHAHLLAHPQDSVELGALNVRCVELHTYTMGGGLLDPRHRDCGSVLSLSVMLSDPAAKVGGHFVTWERGKAIVNELELGTAIVFHSERRHNVSPIVRGIRQTLVIELWTGPANVRDRER